MIFGNNSEILYVLVYEASDWSEEISWASEAVGAWVENNERQYIIMSLLVSLTEAAVVVSNVLTSFSDINGIGLAYAISYKI